MAQYPRRMALAEAGIVHPNRDRPAMLVEAGSEHPYRDHSGWFRYRWKITTLLNQPVTYLEISNELPMAWIPFLVRGDPTDCGDLCLDAAPAETFFGALFQPVAGP
jgi:hypothetical protein